MKNNGKKMLSNGAIYLASSIITQLINLFLIPIYTGNLNTGEFGQYNIVNSLQSLLSIGITMGIFSGMCRFFNEYEDSNKLKNIALTFSILWGSICILLAIIISPALSNIVFKGDVNGYKYIQFIFVNSIMTCIIAIYGSYYSMKFEAIKSSGFNILNMVLTWVFSVYFVVNLKGGIIGILKSQCYAETIIVILLFALDIKNIRPCIEYKKLKNMLKYGMGLCIGDISAWVLTLMDRYFIKFMVNLSAVGIYSMAYKIAMLINPLFISPFQRVFTPYKYLVYKEADGKSKIKKIFNYYNFVGWFCVLGLSLFAKFCINILAPSEYVVGFRLVPLIAISYFLWGMSEFYALGLIIANKMLLNSGIATTAAIVNLIFNIALIPSIGMYGAAIATIISYIVANILYFHFGKKYYNLDVSIVESYKFGTVFFVIYGVYLLAEPYITNIYLGLLFSTLLCICYVYICIKLNFISYENIRKILSKFKFITVSYGYIVNFDCIQSDENDKYKILPMTLGDLNEISNEHIDEIDMTKYDILKNRLENNEYEKAFIVVNAKEETCGYFHIAYKNTRCGVINYNIKVSSDIVYLFDDYTFEKYRGIGVHKFSIEARIKIAKRQGYKKAIVNIVSNNIFSEKAYTHSGFNKYKKYVYIHIFNLEKTFAREVSM